MRAAHPPIGQLKHRRRESRELYNKVSVESKFQLLVGKITGIKVIFKMDPNSYKMLGKRQWTFFSIFCIERAFPGKKG